MASGTCNLSSLRALRLPRPVMRSSMAAVRDGITEVLLPPGTAGCRPCGPSCEGFPGFYVAAASSRSVCACVHVCMWTIPRRLCPQHAHGAAHTGRPVCADHVSTAVPPLTTTRALHHQSTDPCTSPVGQPTIHGNRRCFRQRSTPPTPLLQSDTYIFACTVLRAPVPIAAQADAGTVLLQEASNVTHTRRDAAFATERARCAQCTWLVHWHLPKVCADAVQQLLRVTCTTTPRPHRRKYSALHAVKSRQGQESAICNS